MLIFSISKSESNNSDELNLFIVNYVLIANHIKSGSFYFEPNFIKSICEKNIESVIIKHGDWKEYEFSFEKDGKIKSIFDYVNILEGFKYSKVNDTLLINDSLNHRNYKFYFVNNRIKSFEYKRLNSNGKEFESFNEIEFDVENFSIEIFNYKYYFDYKKNFLANGRTSKNLFTTLFCGSGVDIFRKLNYNQDTIINTINKSNLDNYFEGVFPPPFEFNYKGIKNSIENSFDVFREDKLRYKFKLNDKGLVSNVFHYFDDGNVEEYNFLYTYY